MGYVVLFSQGPKSVYVDIFSLQGLRFMKHPDDPIFKHRKGRIYTFDLNHPENGPVELTIDWDGRNGSTFNPHGITVWQDAAKGRGKVMCGS